MKRIHTLVPAWALLTLLAGPAGLRAGEAKAQKLTPPQRVEALTRVIRQAAGPREALTAYTRATAIDARNVPLHRTQMRRMLQFGLPQLAHRPALSLTRLDEKDGMAWGVVGYMRGRRGQWVQALVATVRAAVRIPDDPSVQNNLGQLIGWYEHQRDLPKLPAPVRRAMQRHRKAWDKHPAFAAAGRRMREAYRESDKWSEKLNKRADAAQEDVRRLRKQARKIDREVRDLSRDVDDLEDRLALLYRTRVRVRVHARRRRDPNSPGPRRRRYYRPTYLGLRQSHEEIVETRDEIDDLKRERRILRADGLAVLRDLRDRQADLRGIGAKLGKARRRAEQHFRWDPPAVDGVVTDEKPRLPPPPRRGPEPPAKRAAKRLALARAYLTNDMPRQAETMLREILAAYPGTESAAEAARLLAGLRLRPTGGTGGS